VGAAHSVSNPYPDIHGDLELGCLWDLPGHGTWLKVPLGKTEHLIAELLAYHAWRRDRDPAAPPAPGYRAESLQILFGECRVLIGVDTSPVVPGMVSQPVAGSVKSTGAQLVAAFPPRPSS
jgi:hypothetical protein